MDIQLAVHLVFAGLGLGAAVLLLVESPGHASSLVWVSLLGVLATGLGLSMPGTGAGRFGTLLFVKLVGTVLVGVLLYWLVKLRDVAESGFDAPELGIPALLWIVVFLLGVQLAHP